MSVYVTVNLNGVDYTVRADSNGHINIPTADLPVGQHTVQIRYYGNGNYNDSDKLAIITVDVT